LAEALVEYGCRVSVITLESDLNKVLIDTINGVERIKIPGRSFLPGMHFLMGRRNMIQFVSRFLKKNKIDIIETSDFMGYFLFTPNWKIPRVVRIGGGETFFRSFLKEKLHWKHKWMEKQSIQKAHAVACKSEFGWQQAREIFNLKHIETAIIPNPVDTRLFKPSSNQKEDPGRIVYSGTFIRKKGIIELFKMLPLVFDKNPKSHLVCVGPDAFDLKTRSQSTIKLALEHLPKRFHNRVTFLGHVDHFKISDVINTASVCVFPSFVEVFPNAWLEAMACEKAIVASNFGVGPEVIINNESGFLCNPQDHNQFADCILKILEDQDLRRKLGKGARQRVENFFSQEAIVKKNIEWYTKVIQEYSK